MRIFEVWGLLYLIRIPLPHLTSIYAIQFLSSTIPLTKNTCIENVLCTKESPNSPKHKSLFLK